MRLLRAPAPEIDFLAPEESARLLADRAEPLWNGMVLVALRAGLRLGELFALERRDADLDRRVLTVARSYVNGVLGTPKSNRTRHIPLTADLFDFFVRAPRVGLLFGRPGGGPQTHSTARSAMNRLCRRAGLRHIGWHALRHTFASDLIAAAVPLLAVQQLLGHASITMTMRYAHLGPSALRGAIDSLDRFVERHDIPNFGHPAGNAPSEAALRTPVAVAA